MGGNPDFETLFFHNLCILSFTRRIVSKRSKGYLILGCSISSIALSIAIFLVGLSQIAEIDVQENAIFSGNSGSVEVENYGSYSVFVNSDYNCDDVEVSIYIEDGMDTWEYFNEGCDSFLNEDGWTYVGYFNSDFDGNLNVDASRQVSIIDDMTYADEGGLAVLISLPFCCCGLIGLVVAIMMLLNGKDNSNSPEIFITEPASPVNEMNGGDSGEKPVWWENEEIEY